MIEEYIEIHSGYIQKKRRYVEWYPTHKHAVEALVRYTARNIFMKGGSKMKEFEGWAIQRFEQYYWECLHGPRPKNHAEPGNLHLKNVKKQAFVDCELFVWDCPVQGKHNVHTPLRPVPIKMLTRLMDRVPNIELYLPENNQLY